MTASQPLPGTTSSVPLRSVARSLAAGLLALACLCATVPAADAAGPRGHDARRAHAHTALGRHARLPVHAARAGQAGPRAHAVGAGHARLRAHTTRAGHAGPRAHAAGGCVTAAGMLRSQRSVLRSQRRLLCLMNRARARFGLPPLRTNRCLHRVGARHAHDMVNRRYFAHTTPNGWDPGRRARASGYVPRRAAWLVGENIAWGVAGAARPNWVMRAWMHSPPHRHNILSRHFRDVGIGVARGVPVRGFRGVRLRATFSVEFGAHRGRTRCG